MFIYQSLVMFNRMAQQGDLGCEGKGYHHGDPTEEWFIKMMRK